MPNALRWLGGGGHRFHKRSSVKKTAVQMCATFVSWTSKDDASLSDLEEEQDTMAMQFAVTGLCLLLRPTRPQQFVMLHWKSFFGLYFVI